MITLGAAFTGKTCLLARYFKNIFEKTSPTITIDFFTKSLKVQDKNVMVTAYDTAGSESYRSMTQKYVRDKHCLFFVFDLTNKKSFKELDEWYDWSKELRRKDCIMILIGSKKDMEEKREVSNDEALEWANQHNMGYFEVSSKENWNVKEVFEFAVQKCLRRFKLEMKTD